MSKRTLIAWSSGKDSAWALHVLRREPDIELAGLFCTVNKTYDRVAMHAVRVELLRLQAQCVGLPLYLIPIPYPCSNDAYDAAMTAFIAEAQQQDVECFAFGDLFLEDVRRYREARLKDTGIVPLFPLWGVPTSTLSRTMVDSGLQAVITCVDPRVLAAEFSGREYDDAFLRDLPQGADPCGENGEFHSFAYAGPMFRQALGIRRGETVERDGFVFTDLLPSAPEVAARSRSADR